MRRATTDSPTSRSWSRSSTRPNGSRPCWSSWAPWWARGSPPLGRSGSCARPIRGTGPSQVLRRPRGELTSIADPALNRDEDEDHEDRRRGAAGDGLRRQLRHLARPQPGPGDRRALPRDGDGRGDDDPGGDGFRPALAAAPGAHAGVVRGPAGADRGRGPSGADRPAPAGARRDGRRRAGRAGGRARDPLPPRSEGPQGTEAVIRTGGTRGGPRSAQLLLMPEMTHRVEGFVPPRAPDARVDQVAAAVQRGGPPSSSP